MRSNHLIQRTARRLQEVMAQEGLGQVKYTTALRILQGLEVEFTKARAPQGLSPTALSLPLPTEGDHTLVLGKANSGKSTFLESLITQGLKEGPRVLYHNPSPSPTFKKRFPLVEVFPALEDFQEAVGREGEERHGALARGESLPRPLLVVVDGAAMPYAEGLLFRADPHDRLLRDVLYSGRALNITLLSSLPWVQEAPPPGAGYFKHVFITVREGSAGKLFKV